MATLGDLTLHLYDHCPFCVRVELVLGWQAVPFTRTVYGYGDTLGSSKGLYYGGTTLTGEKQLPVLEQLHGDGSRSLTPESGDIITNMMSILAQEHPQVVLPPPSQRPELEQFFGGKALFKSLQRQLCRPRLVQMGELKDWARPEDILYAREKHEQGGFGYDEAAAADHCNKEAMAELLRQLEPLLLCPTSFNSEGLGWDDVLYLPELRTLSCVEELEWPPRLRAYVEQALRQAGVTAYWERG